MEKCVIEFDIRLIDFVYFYVVLMYYIVHGYTANNSYKVKKAHFSLVWIETCKNKIGSSQRRPLKIKDHVRWTESQQKKKQTTKRQCNNNVIATLHCGSPAFDSICIFRSLKFFRVTHALNSGLHYRRIFHLDVYFGADYTQIASIFVCEFIFFSAPSFICQMQQNVVEQPKNTKYHQLNHDNLMCAGVSARSQIKCDSNQLC